MVAGRSLSQGSRHWEVEKEASQAQIPAAGMMQGLGSKKGAEAAKGASRWLYETEWVLA